MAKYTNKFYGQHEDERVLYVIRPHSLVMLLRFMKFIVVGLIIFLGFTFIGMQIPLGGGIMIMIGVILALLVGGGGIVMTMLGERNNVGYITDRRVVRFQAETPWMVNTRTLSWEEVVKVKTFAPNLFWRMMNVGTVVVHAKSTIVTTNEDATHRSIAASYASDDDVSLNDVWYYRDLGNYIDKILYAYRRKPEELVTMRPFVTKPRGRRG